MSDPKSMPGPSKMEIVEKTTETFKTAEIPVLRRLYQYALHHLEKDSDPGNEELIVLARRLLKTVLDHEKGMHV